jgi:hypothetical protein
VSTIEFKIVRLGTDYHGRIDDFSIARNSFLSSNEWVLFIDNDEEPTQMLLTYLNQLEPTFPYYWIRRINLHNGRYREAWNPDYAPRLLSNRVKFVGRVHEKVVPKDPHGIIDFPIIHNHLGEFGYENHWYQDHPLYILWTAVKKALQVIKDR